jgi:hypothetical protein
MPPSIGLWEDPALISLPLGVILARYYIKDGRIINRYFLLGKSGFYGCGNEEKIKKTCFTRLS